jgi:hypothetical protein
MLGPGRYGFAPVTIGPVDTACTSDLAMRLASLFVYLEILYTDQFEQPRVTTDCLSIVLSPPTIEGCRLSGTAN